MKSPRLSQRVFVAALCVSQQPTYGLSSAYAPIPFFAFDKF